MPQTPPQVTLATGAVLAKRYRIEQLIGSGGYATVYRATDLTLGYERAIKEVSDPDPAVRIQFRLEAELLINSKHPNIPHGYHLIEDRDRLYLVMDYVHGKDLEELLNESLTQRQRPLDEAQVLKWALDICGALDEMHNLRVPVIHRDIKPANIKITPDGWPILIDFGLAKLHQKGGPTMTAAQGVSPGFAPPEQYMAKGRTDARTDIYGLGATLYACLTGKDPPEAPGRLMAQTGAGGTTGMQLQTVRRLNPRVSEETDRLVMRALDLSPNGRQQSARQLRDELAAALQKLTGASINAPSTLVMGLACPRCGTQNRPDAARCVNCGGPLRPVEGSQRMNGNPNGAYDGSGKRPAVVPAGATAGRLPAAAKAPAKGMAVAAQRAAAVAADQRTGRQVAVDGGRALRPAEAPDGPRSAKQRAVAASPGPLLPPAAAGATAARMSAVAPAAVVPLPTKMGRQTALQPAAPRAKVLSTEYGRAWIKLGDAPLSRLGKVMLALAGVEVLWGSMVVTLGLIVLSFDQRPLPVPQLVIGWVALVLIASVLGAQALTRPVLRRGRMSPVRRWVQGSAILLYSLAVQAAGVFGAVVFQANQPNPPLAIVAYLLFGISTLLAGVVGIFTALD